VGIVNTAIKECGDDLTVDNFLDRPVAALQAARDRIAQEDRFWLGGLFFASEIPGWSLLEVSAGDATLKLSDAEVVDGFRKLLSYAKSAV